MEVADEHVYSTSLIKCTVNYSGNKYNINIGVLEILESVSFMLECECVKNEWYSSKRPLFKQSFRIFIKPRCKEIEDLRNKHECLSLK